MEEDIMILESECYYLEELGYLRENNHFIRFNQALGNLIKGYRELEKQLDSSRKANELLNKTNNELRLEIRTTYSKVVNDIISKFNLGDEYIPKSKIKEKIEELKETADEDNQDDYIKIQVLKELAEAFEKHIPNIE